MNALIVICCLVTQSCLFCDPMDCSPPGSSVLGILQASILIGLPFPSSGDLLDPGIEPVSPAVASGFFTSEPLGQPHYKLYLFIYILKQL